jgi:hypothetical protein
MSAHGVTEQLLDHSHLHLPCVFTLQELAPSAPRLGAAAFNVNGAHTPLALFPAATRTA